MSETTTPATLRALADRVEREAPSHTLWWEIFRAAQRKAPTSNEDAWEQNAKLGDFGEMVSVCAWESAAMELLPPCGHPLWTLVRRGISHGERGMWWTAQITVPSREFRGKSSHHPACALLAAVLRAWAADPTHG